MFSDLLSATERAYKAASDAASDVAATTTKSFSDVAGQVQQGTRRLGKRLLQNGEA